MLARLGIVVGIVVVGFVAYQLGTRWQVARVSGSSGKQNGATAELLSQLRPGVPGIIYFWSPDCPPCLAVQKPALAALQRELGEDGVQVVAVNVYDRPDLADKWGVLSLPTTFVVDADGEPRGINHGVTREDKLRRQVAGLN